MLQMVTDLADSFFGADINFDTLDPSTIKKCAGALGGLSPFKLEKIPQASVLDALDSIKNNSNLSSKQVS